MDPNKTLEDLRVHAAAVLELLDTVPVSDDSYMQALQGHANDLAEAAQALDQWLRNGGFKPADWTTKGDWK